MVRPCTHRYTGGGDSGSGNAGGGDSAGSDATASDAATRDTAASDAIRNAITGFFLDNARNPNAKNGAIYYIQHLSNF